MSRRLYCNECGKHVTKQRKEVNQLKTRVKFLEDKTERQTKKDWGK